MMEFLKYICIKLTLSSQKTVVKEYEESLHTMKYISKLTWETVGSFAKNLKTAN